jgi:hypothetical protein
MLRQRIARTAAVLAILAAATLIFVASAYSQGVAAAMPAFNPNNFVNNQAINNLLFPLVPGTTFVYSGATPDGQDTLEITVSHRTKTILGVRTLEVDEIDQVDGDLVEFSVNFFAQDKLGNVWYFGEASKLYTNGRVVSTEGSWQGGVNGALPGIIMEAHPRVGDIYSQEDAPGVAQDMAKVLSVTTTVTVPFGTFRNCLKTREFSPLEPGINEFKFYTPGVGLLLEIDNDGNRLELVDIIRS